MIEYFRLHIEYLWNAARREPPFENLGGERQGGTINLNKTGYNDFRHFTHFKSPKADLIAFATAPQGPLFPSVVSEKA